MALQGERAGSAELYAMPGHLIRRAHQASTAIFAEECAGFDLTSVQYAALAALERHPGIDATRLSALIAFDRSTLGDVLERLEAKGWIVRSAGADRRVKTLALTPDGSARLNQVQPAVRRVQQRLLSRLSADERNTLVRLLATLADVSQDQETC